MLTTQNNIQFTDHSTDLNGNITTWQWNFGDNTNSTLQNPTHNYEDNGVYTVTLTIDDDEGATNTTTQNIIITNTPPIADFTYTPTSPLQNDTVQFTDQSNDPDGNIVTWQWDFGDGTHSNEKNTHHQYKTNKTYTITLYVTDDDNTMNSTTKTINIQEKPKDEKINETTEETSDITILLAISLMIIIIIIIFFYFTYYKSKQKKKEKKEIKKKKKDKKTNKIAICPKCKTHVYVKGIKGEKIKIKCPNCGKQGNVII
jgi:PKD repeat protein